MSRYIKLNLIIILIFLLLTLLFFKNYCKLTGYLENDKAPVDSTPHSESVDLTNNITDKLELGDNKPDNSIDDIKIKPKKKYTEFTKEEIEDLTFSNVT